MKKERYIWEEKSKKKGKYFRVVIRIEGISKTDYGRFYHCDYPSPKVALEAARRCRDEALRDIHLNRVIEHSMTVSEAYEQSKDLFLDSIKTHERHDVLYKQLIPTSLRQKNLEDITTADIQRTVNSFAQTHTTEQTKHAFVVWKQIYQTANMNEIPIVDRTKMIRIPKSKVVSKRHARSCSSEELELFLGCLLNYNASTPQGQKRSKDVWYALRIMQYLGLRPQEVFALCREDIDLRSKTISINHSVGSTKELKRQLITTKTDESIGTLPIPDSLYPILVELLSESDSSPLLVDSDGLPYDTGKISTMLCNLSKKKGVPKVNLYMMRHNFSTDMLKSTNNDVKLVQSMMRHANPSMTLSYAEKASKEDMEEALKKRKFS